LCGCDGWTDRKAADGFNIIIQEEIQLRAEQMLNYLGSLKKIALWK